MKEQKYYAFIGGGQGAAPTRKKSEAQFACSSPQSCSPSGDKEENPGLMVHGVYTMFGGTWSRALAKK